MGSRVYFIVPAISVIFLAAFFSFAYLAHAESKVWSTTQPSNFFFRTTNPAHGSAPYFEVLSNPNISIAYNVRVVNAATGGVLPSGSTVPQGTIVRFHFIPHVPADIYWFATGHAADSPNGDWVEGAANPYAGCVAKDLFYGPYVLGKASITNYIPFAVNPPTQQVAGLTGMTCTALPNGSQQCTLNQAGTFYPQFDFAQTYAKFYYHRYVVQPGENACEQYPDAMTVSTVPNPPLDRYRGASAGYMQAFTLTVPAQSIPYSITVTPAPPAANPTPTVTRANPPSKPVVTQVGTSLCVTGTPYTISMVATSPTGNSLRYGIDWNDDGSVDQYAPATGYVPSGTPQTASRTYTTANTKTVRVLAQDNNGSSSDWTKISFTCSAASTNSDTGSLNNTTGDGGSVSPDLTITATPSLLHSGETTKLNWSASGVRSCSVSAPNGDSWKGLNSIVGGETSKPVTAQTIYTLACRDLQNRTLTKTATVSIVPSFQER